MDEVIDATWAWILADEIATYLCHDGWYHTLEAISECFTDVLSSNSLYTCIEYQLYKSFLEHIYECMAG